MFLGWRFHFLAEEAMQLSLAVGHSPTVSAIHDLELKGAIKNCRCRLGIINSNRAHPNKAVSLFEVVAPIRTNRLLTTHIPAV